MDLICKTLISFNENLIDLMWIDLEFRRKGIREKLLTKATQIL